MNVTSSVPATKTATIAIQPRHYSYETGYRNVFNVRAYGATGSGTAGEDDTAAIQACINAAAYANNYAGSNKGGTIVYFPKGRYNISDSLTVIDDTANGNQRALIFEGENAGTVGVEVPSILV